MSSNVKTFVDLWKRFTAEEKAEAFGLLSAEKDFGQKITDVQPPRAPIEETCDTDTEQQKMCLDFCEDPNKRARMTEMFQKQNESVRYQRWLNS